MELETWNDLASIYIKSSQWQDAEICLSKSEAISCYSASRLYTAGRYISPHYLLMHCLALTILTCPCVSDATFLLL